MICEATTRAGRQCRAHAKREQRFCSAHLGAHRPTKLTPETSEAICRAIRAGNYREVAARHAGVGHSTLYSWLEKGEARLEPYADFREALQKAEADAEVHAVAIVRQAMPESWQAAMTYLERKFPDRWGRRERLALTGPSGGPIQTQELVPSEADWHRQVAEVLSEAEAASENGSGPEDA